MSQKAYTVLLSLAVLCPQRSSIQSNILRWWSRCHEQYSCQAVCMAFADALALAQPCREFSACMQVAIDFSNSQQEDMLHLRCLLYGKLGQLSRARAAIMDQLPAKV
ncbi:TPA: hypothetical protein ACH3X2_013743 [Trebouxia sp. C0005]